MATSTEEERAAEGTRARTRHEVLVIGAGQAGLAVAHQLTKAGVEVLLLEAGARIGDAWRRRWDSLRLFTAAEFVGLPDFPFPGDPNAFPTKDELADYLEAYAARMALRVRFNTRVDALEREGDLYVARAGGLTFESRHVVVTTGPYQQQRLPEWAAALDERIVQIPSSLYKNAAQLPPGDVLVVGAGNTGAELALEAARAGRRVLLSGRDVGQVPRLMRLGNGRPFWFLATRLFTVGTPIGRKIRASLRAGHGGPLVRIRRRELVEAGIERVGRVTGAREGRPQVENGRALDVACVLWCSGYRMDFSWIRRPILTADGYPLHEQGRVTTEPGLYFVGLPFQRNLVSATLVGVGRDSALVARSIVERLQAEATAPATALRPVHT